MAINNIVTNPNLRYLTLTDEDVHQIHEQCMYYLHRYLSVYSAEELIENELKFRLFKAAVLNLTLTVVT